MTIIAKVDVTKIDKTKFFKGEKGLYMDLVLIETPDSRFGDDYMVVQGVTKEDRDKGIKGAILGNAKIRGQQQAPKRDEPRAADDGEDVAF